MFGETILHKLANRKDATKEMFFEHIDLGTDVNQVDLMKDSPIGLLLYNEREDIVEAILEKYPKSVDPSLFLRDILNILNEKEKKKHLKIFQNFMKKNDLYNNPGRRFSEQIIEIGKRAAEDGESGLVMELLKIEVTNRSKLFKGVFSAAFKKGDVQLIEKLFNEHKNQLWIAIEDDDSLLHHACKNGDYFSTDFALNYFNANIEYFVPKEELKGRDEVLLYPPLSWAILSRNKKVIFRMVDTISAQGVQKINFLANNTKEEQYDPLAMALHSRDYAISEFLLNNGYFTNQYVFKNLREEREKDRDKLKMLATMNAESTFKDITLKKNMPF